MKVNVITPVTLKSLLNDGEDVQIVDIRESYELEVDGKSESMHIPMGDLIDRLDEIPKSDKIIFHCSSGNRSLNMMNFLLMNGFYRENFYHLEGGFQAWSKFI